MMNVLRPYLRQRSPLLLDGALATELEARGCDLTGKLWSARILAEAPQLVREVHLDYFRAGADVVISGSYQATPQGLVAAGFSLTESKRLLQLSVELARQARNDFGNTTELSPLIAASVGPYGAYLADGSEYRGQYGLSTSALTKFHAQRLEWLMAAEPDLIAFETLPELREAEALLRLLEQYPERQAWFSFSARDEAHISEGEPVEKAIRLLGGHPQVAAVGINCTAPRYISGLLRRMSAAGGFPLLAYPNSGEGWDAENRCWVPESRAALGFGALPAEWAEAGAQIIGGCCRTGPADVEALYRWREKDSRELG